MVAQRQTTTRDIPHRLPSRLALALAAVLLVFGLGACSTSSESGAEGPEGPESGPDDEESGVGYERGDTYNMVRSGARLILRYDAASETFRGTVTNETDTTLARVRVEVHLIGDTELGPTEPMDLAPGETIMVSLAATGRSFSQWSPHPEVGSGSPVDPTGTSTFAPSLGGWAVIGGVDIGIEHTGHGLSARHEWQGGAWTSSLAPDPGPEHQPSGDATWTGEWVGYHASDPAIVTGAARVTVTLGGAATEATLSLGDVPTLGTLQWDAMAVSGGRFDGQTTADSRAYEAVGQFGGPNQDGVVGHVTGSDFRSVFHGEKD